MSLIENSNFQGHILERGGVRMVVLGPSASIPRLVDLLGDDGRRYAMYLDDVRRLARPPAIPAAPLAA